MEIEKYINTENKDIDLNYFDKLIIHYENIINNMQNEIKDYKNKIEILNIVIENRFRIGFEYDLRNYKCISSDSEIIYK